MLRKMVRFIFPFSSERFFFFLIGFLELINNMLTTGMVPALFADEEREAIIGNVRRISGFISSND